MICTKLISTYDLNLYFKWASTWYSLGENNDFLLHLLMESCKWHNDGINQQNWLEKHFGQSNYKRSSIYFFN